MKMQMNKLEKSNAVKKLSYKFYMHNVYSRASYKQGDPNRRGEGAGWSERFTKSMRLRDLNERSD